MYKNSQGRWVINDPSNGSFDGIIAAVGTCGDPKMVHIPGQDEFKGGIYHSSDLDGREAKGKKVIIIGGGASAVEALEFVVSEKAAEASVLARVRFNLKPLLPPWLRSFRTGPELTKFSSV